MLSLQKLLYFNIFMYSLKELYRIGHGPSSSHTMGPRNAATRFLDRNITATRFEVTLYGSLAATGKGHMTDQAILEVLGKEHTTIVWEPKIFLPFHPNGMKFRAFDTEDRITDEWTVYSVGGGALAEEGEKPIEHKQVYEMSTATEILSWCISTGKSYWEYVEECEGPEIWDYLLEVWDTMKNAVQRGLEQEGVLPGPLCLRRKAALYYVRAEGHQQSMRTRGLLFSYALAVSEENAAGGKSLQLPPVAHAVYYQLYYTIFINLAIFLNSVSYVLWLQLDCLETLLRRMLLFRVQRWAAKERLV